MEGDYFQALYENHSQVIDECHLKLKFHFIEAGDLDLVEKKKLGIISFVESVHKISEGFLTYNDRKDTDSHMCSIYVIRLYSNRIAVHLDALKERILEE